MVDRLILEKIEADEAKKQAQQEMMAYVKKQEECEQEFTRSLQSVQVQLSQEWLHTVRKKLGKNNKELTSLF